MISSYTSGAYRRQDAAVRGAPAVVEEMLKLLGKSSRAQQLYLSNNPTYLRTLELLRGSISSVWDQLPELVLGVSERALLLDDRPVFQEPERTSDTLPWLLYKDGVRELRLLPGFEADEVETLLGVLSQLRRSAASEDDAITLLWERDFSFLRYRYVEPFGDDELGGYELAESPGRLSGAPATVEPPPPPPAGVVRMQDFDGAIHFLAERELAYLNGALALEYEHDLRSDAADQLLDVLELVPAARVRDEVCTALEQLVLHGLSSGDYTAATHLLRETRVSAARAAAIAPIHIERLGRLAELFSQPEVLGQLLELVEVGAAPPSDAELQELLGELRPAALGTIFAWIDRVQTTRVRNALRAAADRLALESSTELIRLIGSDDPVIAGHAVSRAGIVRAQGAVPALAAALAHSSRDVRLAAAEALAEIGTPGALQALTTILDDDHREARLAAIRAIGARGFRGALPQLEALMRDRRLRDRDLTEQMAIFESYGALCGDEGVPLLDSLLNGRSFLGRRSEPNMRACAAVALGRVATPRAEQALRRTLEEKDAVVRNAVQRALRSVR